MSYGRLEIIEKYSRRKIDGGLMIIIAMVYKIYGIRPLFFRQLVVLSISTEDRGSLFPSLWQSHALYVSSSV